MAATCFVMDHLMCCICVGTSHDVYGGHMHADLKTVYSLLLPICAICKSHRANIVVGRPSCRKWLFPLAHFWGEMSFPTYMYANGGGPGGGEASPKKIGGPRGGAPRDFLILRIKNKRFSLKDLNMSSQN